MLAPLTINWLAVALAFVASMAIGGALYARPLMGGWWMKQVGLEPAGVKKEEAMRALAVSAVLGLILAIFYAVLFDWTLAESPIEGAIVGLIAGLAFGIPIGMVHSVFEGRPLGVGLLYGGHHLAELVVMGVIFGAFG